MRIHAEETYRESERAGEEGEHMKKHEDNREAASPASLNCLGRPGELWLQWNGDGEPDAPGEVFEDEVTWNRERVWSGDIRYVCGEGIIVQYNRAQREYRNAVNIYKATRTDNEHNKASYWKGRRDALRAFLPTDQAHPPEGLGAASCSAFNDETTK